LTQAWLEARVLEMETDDSAHRRPRSSALTIRVYAQETLFHYMGIVGRDAALGQQPVTARPRPGQRPARGRAGGWPRGGAAAGGLAVCAGADSRLTVGY